jgi:hypothetical protein
MMTLALIVSFLTGACCVSSFYGTMEIVRNGQRKLAVVYAVLSIIQVCAYATGVILLITGAP